ncbi:YqaA family protein [Hydrogenophilus thermoluteolus]|uniref:YqaA family protein n=1 Tax=Hydrogenophilus thermoluteolus TaxID=297 RepID=UPI003F676A6E
MIEETLKKTVIALVGLLLLMGALGWAFQKELVAAAEWVANHLGFPGIALVILIGDSFVLPFPPDSMLVVVSRSHMAANWWLYVFGIGAVSAWAGIQGYFIGRWLEHFPTLHRIFGRFRDEHGPQLRKYGFWWVVLGATTPLPFSVTTWTAGMLQLPLTHVAAACLFRIPRFFIYYGVIHAGLGLFS